MSLTIETSFPGGNVFIEDINGKEVLLTRDMRNTKGDWFYWSFKAIFDAPGVYRFSFTQPNSCTSCGPAASYDDGKTWEWLGFDCVSGERNVFTCNYDGSRNRSVIFCVGMQYQQYHLDTFIARHKDCPHLTQSLLTKSRKNRDVTLLHIEDSSIKTAKKQLFFSSRHHCCEMMATYALEGILETALGDDELGRTFRSRYIIDCVPFADTDGVIEGDQGKNRSPHDHNRDYSDAPIYPEVRAIQKLLLGKEVFFALDMHCPWLYGAETNETIYFPGAEEEYYAEQQTVFSGILQKNAPAAAPHFTKNNIPFGTKWNTKKNFSGPGFSCAGWIRHACKPVYASSIEIPYAITGDIPLSVDSARALGRSIAESILEYDNNR